MVAPPPPPTRRGAPFRQYWGYTRRPYTGCGCLYTLVVFILIWFLVSLFIDAVRFY